MEAMTLVGSQTHGFAKRQLRGQHYCQPVIELFADSLAQGIIQVR